MLPPKRRIYYTISIQCACENMVINYDVSSWEKWEMHATLFDFFHSDSLQSTYFLTMNLSIGIITFIGSDTLLSFYTFRSW